jgi:hypothetical protein
LISFRDYDGNVLDVEWEDADDLLRVAIQTRRGESVGVSLDPAQFAAFAAYGAAHVYRAEGDE